MSQVAVTECCIIELHCFVNLRKLCFHLSDIQKCPVFSKQAAPRILHLKASQMSKVLDSSHVEKMKNLREKNFKGEANNKQLDGEDVQRNDYSS